MPDQRPTSQARRTQRGRQAERQTIKGRQQRRRGNSETHPSQQAGELPRGQGGQGVGTQSEGSGARRPSPSLANVHARS